MVHGAFMDMLGYYSLSTYFIDGDAVQCRGVRVRLPRAQAPENALGVSLNTHTCSTLPSAAAAQVLIEYYGLDQLLN